MLPEGQEIIPRVSDDQILPKSTHYLYHMHQFVETRVKIGNPNLTRPQL